MMPVAAVHAAPPIDDHVGSERANYAHHVLKNLIAPDFFGFFRRFRIAKIFSTREIEFHAIAASGGEKLLRSNQSHLRGPFGAKIVLPPFPTRQTAPRNIRREPS